MTHEYLGLLISNLPVIKGKSCYSFESTEQLLQDSIKDTSYITNRYAPVVSM